MRRLGVALVLAALTLGGHGAYIFAKAQLAQLLLERAWARTQAGERDARPWPWADTRPVARLSAPSQGVELIVLEGASGRTMAFGPGLLSSSAAPGTLGNTIISAHRDTHFAFLAKARVGDALVLEDPTGARHRYEVESLAVVDREDTRALRPSEDATLTLVTCYPFDAIVPGGPLRYVVRARAAPLRRWSRAGDGHELARVTTRLDEPLPDASRAAITDALEVLDQVALGGRGVVHPARP